MNITFVNETDRTDVVLYKVASFLLSCVLLQGIIMTGCFAAPVETERSAKMPSFIAEQVVALSADLVPFFGEPTTNMLLVKVVDVKLGSQMEDGLEVEIGPATLEVMEVLHSNTLIKGSHIEVLVKRFTDTAIRDRNSFNHWNNLDLAKGELLLLSGRIITKPNVLMGQAAMHVESANSQEVIAARQCYVIENLKDEVDKKRTLLGDALTGHQDLLRFYALDVLGRRSLLGRAEGATLISKAIDSENLAPENKIELGYFLTRKYFFDSTLKDDTANVNVAATLAKGMVNETNNERRMEWMNYLSSCVLGEFSARKATDNAMRYGLIRAISTPTSAQVTNTLSKLATLAHADDRERIMGLLQAWQASSHGW